MRHTATILLSLLFISLYAGKTEHTWQFSDPSIRNNGDFQVISFDNTSLTGMAGEPALPYMGVKLMLPPGEEAVSISFSFSDEINLDGTYTIYPQQPSRPVSAGSDGIFHQDTELYRSSGIYPEKAWGEYSTQFLNGHSFLLSAFTPVRYIPSTGKVSYYREVTVSIETRSTRRAENALMNLNSSARVTDRIRALAQNPETAYAYPVKEVRDDGYDILIITPGIFAVTYEQLASLYLIRGLKTEIVTTETISSGVSGQDLPEKIRNYITQEYQENSIAHVVLGGDAEYVPYRGFYCYVISGSGYEESNIPADVYFSSLDGTWNDDGDGYWGEIGEDDLLPDVAVARIPVSTIAQLNSYIQKTTRYQDQPVPGEFRDPIMAGEELYTNPLTYGEDYLELLIGYHEDNGYTTDGIPEDYNFTKMYDHLAYWGGDELVQAINQGTSFVHHSGHANQTYVMRLGISDINNANFAGANGTDHNYTLVYTHGCLCGAFDENDCIGEAMVLIDNFAVAGAFNSRYGWFNEGQTEGPSAHMHREFVDALYNDKESRIGTAHMISKIESSVWVNAPGQWEEGALRWCFYCCNILGDPVLGIWTDEPISIETAYPEEILPENTSVNVTVTSDGQPAEGLNCVIMAGGDMLGCCATDAAGQAVISVPGGFYNITEADLVISGYNCLPHQYPLSIQVGVPEPVGQAGNIRNIPNPFSLETTLEFNLDEAGPISIVFYLPSGMEIGRQSATGCQGLNRIRPAISQWPEGLIHVRIISGNQVFYHRMIHLKK